MDRVSTWILGSYFMGVNLVWGFQCQAVSLFKSSMCPSLCSIKRSHPSVPTMIPARRRRGRRSRMARQATAAGGARVLEVRPRRRHARMVGRGTAGAGVAVAGRLVQGGALASGGSAANHAIRQPCMRSGAGRDHDALCASEARLPGGWDHSSIGLAPMLRLRYTTHLGHAGPPGMPVSRARVSPGWRTGRFRSGGLGTTPSGPRRRRHSSTTRSAACAPAPRSGSCGRRPWRRRSAPGTSGPARVRLEQQKAPGQLDHAAANPRVARLADPLVAPL